MLFITGNSVYTQILGHVCTHTYTRAHTHTRKHARAHARTRTHCFPFFLKVQMIAYNLNILVLTLIICMSPASCTSTTRSKFLTCMTLPLYDPDWWQLESVVGSEGRAWYIPTIALPYRANPEIFETHVTPNPSVTSLALVLVSRPGRRSINSPE